MKKKSKVTKFETTEEYLERGEKIEIVKSFLFTWHEHHIQYPSGYNLPGCPDGCYYPLSPGAI